MFTRRTVLNNHSKLENLSKSQFGVFPKLYLKQGKCESRQTEVIPQLYIETYTAITTENNVIKPYTLGVIKYLILQLVHFISHMPKSKLRIFK